MFKTGLQNMFIIQKDFATDTPWERQISLHCLHKKKLQLFQDKFLEAFQPISHKIARLNSFN